MTGTKVWSLDTAVCLYLDIYIDIHIADLLDIWRNKSDFLFQVVFPMSQWMSDWNSSSWPATVIVWTIVCSSWFVDVLFPMETEWSKKKEISVIYDCSLMIWRISHIISESERVLPCPPTITYQHQHISSVVLSSHTPVPLNKSMISF